MTFRMARDIKALICIELAIDHYNYFSTCRIRTAEGGNSTYKLGEFRGRLQRALENKDNFVRSCLPLFRKSHE